MKPVYLTHSDDETKRLGAAIGAQLRPGEALLLRGELGAGKSVLARGAARALGVEGAMPSPTFTIMIPYDGTSCPVYHFDLYRLNDEDELYQAGLDEYFDMGGVCLIEWPLDDPRPQSYIECTVTRGGSDTERRVELDFGHLGREVEPVIDWEAEMVC